MKTFAAVVSPDATGSSATDTWFEVGYNNIRLLTRPCRGELGRFPLIVDINEKILNYIMYLFEKDEDSIVKQALLVLVL